MFWVLKRTVSLTRFFWVPTTYVLIEKQKNKKKFRYTLLTKVLAYLCCHLNPKSCFLFCRSKSASWSGHVHTVFHVNYEYIVISALVQLSLVFERKIVINFFPINLNTCFCAQKNCLSEMVLLNTHKICLGWEIRWLIFNYPLLSWGMKQKH